MAIFKQEDFLGGLNTQLDPAKSAGNSYSLLINGRTRQNVVAPTRRHVNLNGISGNYQGLYAAGSHIILFVSGVAYYANITKDEIVFIQVSNWTTMNSAVSRIYAEIVPATSNLYNRSGDPLSPDAVAESTIRTFNDTIATFPQALYCFDGSSRPQAIFPDGSARILNDYEQWTQDNPEYVPIGVLPAIVGNKLFLVSPDLVRILHSVSGRASDFVVNINSNGDKGGNANTVSQTVSYNPITTLKALSSGQVLVCTLYGTFVLELDYENTFFGEPYLLPIPIFPAGAINELSVVDILQDTAIITQSGIHAFNAVAQAKRESNNFPLGAKIRGLLKNPQEGTCTAIFDDYAFLAVNTIHGYGAFVYDTTVQGFQSLDLSFGRVKQFATTRLAGAERMFFITHNNQIFEAFAGSDFNSTRLYIGDWVPDEADSTVVLEGINTIFTDVHTEGELKISVFSDRVLKESGVIETGLDNPEASPPIPIPFTLGKDAVNPSYKLRDVARGWKTGVMLEWNFEGSLSDISFDGMIEKGLNVNHEIPTVGSSEDLIFVASTGLGNELNPGTDFVSHSLSIEVTEGHYYAFAKGSDVGLLNGKTFISEDKVFVARGDHVYIRGTGTPTFSLRSCQNLMNYLSVVHGEKGISGILHGGDIGDPEGTAQEVLIGKLPFRQDLYAVCGDKDIITESGKYFFGGLQVPRHYTHAFEFVDVFFFNSNPSSPDGINSTSFQSQLVRLWAEQSSKPFKLIVTHFDAYSNASNSTPGVTDLRYLASIPGVSAVLSGHGHAMERFDINSFPFFVCGAGGKELASFTAPAPVEAAWSWNEDYGYIAIHADALTCKLSFKNANGDILDSYAIYA